MALTSKPSSSASPPLKIKVQLMRTFEEGTKNKAGNSIEVVLLESPEGTRIQTRIDEAFSKWIMDISDEKMNADDIDIPKAIGCPYPIKTIARKVYGHSDSYGELGFFDEKAILCHSDDDVDRINRYMLSLLPGQERLCCGDDCIPPRDNYKSSPSDFLLLAPTVFGSCEIPGVPPQVLRLKIGAPIMLLTDVDPSRRLFAGSRLRITKLGDSMLEAAFGMRAEKYLIPKTHMYSPQKIFSTLRRTQFPVILAFAMPINKSQPLSFSKVALYLPRPVLSQGQRYLAISKAKAGTGFKVLITGEDGKPQEDVENVVFQDLFQNV